MLLRRNLSLINPALISAFSYLHPITMSDPNVRFLEAGKEFVDLERVSTLPAIITIFFGGSNLYSANAARNRHSDWDGIIVVRTKLDLFTLVNHRRLELLALLHIATEEMPELQVPEPISPFWGQFDAVRISGFTETHSKRSVKLLSLEYFWSGKTSLDILSFKDRRIYSADSPGHSMVFRIQQATRLPSGLLILHDQLVYQSRATDCVHGHKRSSALFGVTADLIVSGVCLFGNAPFGQEIKSHIMSLYVAATRRRVTTQSFARYTRFPADFVGWLSKELSDLHQLVLPSLGLPSCDCSSPPGQHTFLYGTTRTTDVVAFQDFFARARHVPLEVFQVAQQGLVKSQQRSFSAFSSNSSTYHIMVPALEGGGIKLFGKKSQHQLHELAGAATSAVYYPRIHLPRLTASGDLLYPFLDGISQAELRMTFVRGGRSHWPFFEQLLYAELVKAEDTLRAYRTSLVQLQKEEALPSDKGIHRFFGSRLLDNVRFAEFYHDGFCIKGKAVSMQDFLGLPWKINGIIHPPLQELFSTASEVLHPHSSWMRTCPVAFGLGDAHGANVIIASGTSPDNSRDVVYVDFEVAGFHAVLLDLAKPFYNDIFFEALYADALPPKPGLVYEVGQDFIHVSFTPWVDAATQAIFEIKTRYLLQPLCDFVLGMGGDLESHVTLLSNALLVCATLTRNFKDSEAAMFTNLVIGIIMSTASTWKELYSCFQSVGLGI